MAATSLLGEMLDTWVGFGTWRSWWTRFVVVLRLCYKAGEPMRGGEE